MRAELDKYGIQMPAFGKIGGILANEMPVDEAALHAAVIAINEAIDKNVSQVTKKLIMTSAVQSTNSFRMRRFRYDLHTVLVFWSAHNS